MKRNPKQKRFIEIEKEFPWKKNMVGEIGKYGVITRFNEINKWVDREDEGGTYNDSPRVSVIIFFWLFLLPCVFVIN